MLAVGSQASIFWRGLNEGIWALPVSTIINSLWTLSRSPLVTESSDRPWATTYTSCMAKVALGGTVLWGLFSQSGLFCLEMQPFCPADEAIWWPLFKLFSKSFPEKVVLKTTCYSHCMEIRFCFWTVSFLVQFPAFFPFCFNKLFLWITHKIIQLLALLAWHCISKILPLYV